jgi:hypothetical protein
MAHEDHGEPHFRRWLITQLKHSRWVRFADDTVEQLAERLLVHPEALRIAQRELDEERARKGRELVEVGTRNRLPVGEKHLKGFRATGAVKFSMQMPKVAFDDWKEYCTLRGLESAVILRSAVHSVLTSPTNPRWLGHGWFYKGRREVMFGYNEYSKRHKGWPYGAVTDLPMGVRQALERRAVASRCTATALVRGQIIELLEGRLTRLIIISTTQQLYEDPDRYITLE